MQCCGTFSGQTCPHSKILHRSFWYLCPKIDLDPLPPFALLTHTCRGHKVFDTCRRSPQTATKGVNNALQFRRLRESCDLRNGGMRMSASRFIGRVGGLAVAMGVGAVAFGGTSVAWADSPSSDSSSGAASSARDSAAPRAGSARTAKQTNRKAVKEAKDSRDAVDSKTPSSIAAPSAPDNDAPSKPVAPTLDRGDTEPAQPAAASAAAASSAPEAAAVPVVSTPEIAPDNGAVSAAPKLEAANGSNDPLSQNPLAPAASLINLAALEYSRRLIASPAAAFAPNAAASVSLTSDEQFDALAAEGGQNIALIMGGSGLPIPGEQYILAVFDKFVAPNSPPGTIPEGLFTPEGLYPITGVKSLPLDTSVDQGMTILADTIQKQLDLGNTVTVFGYSQSAILSSLQMPDLGPDDVLNFVFIGNEMNPNGGFLSRFPGLDLPSLGIPFYGATPADTFPVTNYTLEYDGFADFPQYPLNFLSVLNAALGIAFVHGTYPMLTQDQIDQAVSLPTSDPSQTYYVIPTENLPLLAPIRMIPIIGEPIADLLQPALRVIVNLGYGDPNYGWSTNGFANELTTYGIFPDVDFGEVISMLVAGVQQGIQDFIADILPGGSVSQELTALATPQGSTTPLSINSFSDVVTATQSIVTNALDWISGTVTKIADFVSSAAASLYSAYLPTFDIINAIVTEMPAYALTQFLNGVDQIFSGDIIGGAINAVFMPLAAMVGLVTTAALIEVEVLGNAISGALPSSS